MLSGWPFVDVPRLTYKHHNRYSNSSHMRSKRLAMRHDSIPDTLAQQVMSSCPWTVDNVTSSLEITKQDKIEWSHIRRARRRCLQWVFSCQSFCKFPDRWILHRILIVTVDLSIAALRFQNCSLVLQSERVFRSVWKKKCDTHPRELSPTEFSMGITLIVEEDYTITDRRQAEIMNMEEYEERWIMNMDEGEEMISLRF